MFQNLHFRSISVSQFLLSKKLLLLFVLFYSFGTTTYAQAPGNSLNFDGVDDWSPIPLTDYYAGNFTIETWIKTTSTAVRSNKEQRFF